MKGMNFYLRFRRSYENSITENESLKKRLEDSDTNLARLQESYARREKEIAENNLAVQARIRDLECKLEVVCVISKSVLKDHLRIHTRFTSAKIEADRLSMRLLDATNEKAAFHNRTEILSQSILDMKMKFRRAKEKLHKYKEKAQSFYQQLTFASWGRDIGFFVGYIGGFESFQEWIKKPGNLLKVETVAPEDVVPSKGMTLNMLSTDQKEMPHCQGIKCMGDRCQILYIGPPLTYVC
jgi:hypothetical protein